MKFYRGRCLTIACVFMLLGVRVAVASTYFVSSAGSDNNDGTSLASPLLTMRRAAALTNPGDTVYVTNGVYAPFSIRRSGSESGGYISYLAYPGQHPTIAKNATAWNGISIGGSSYIIIDGFNVIGNSRQVSKTEADQAKKGDNNANGNCIGSSKKSHHIIIRNNNISYCPGGGIVLLGDYLSIYKNVIHHNAFWSALATSGITVSGADSDASAKTKIFIYDNVIYRNQNFICNRFQTHPCRITDGEGIIVDDNEASGFRGRIAIINNVVYKNGGPGIEIYRSAHVDVFNNTTYMNNISAEEAPPFKAHMSGGEISVSKSRDVNVLNNIMYAGAYAPVINAAIASATDLRWDYNVMFGAANAKGIGAHDVVRDPMFVNPQAFDFRLRADSPAVRSGTTVPMPREDFMGIPQPADTMDRGAVQFRG